VRVAMQLRRRPDEPVDPEVRAFYDRLLAILARPELHQGSWHLCAASADSLIAALWTLGEKRLLVIVNQAPGAVAGRVTVDLPGLRGHSVALADLLGDERRERDGDELLDRGLEVELPAWGCRVFDCIG
jgi:hypothetical protein